MATRAPHRTKNQPCFVLKGRCRLHSLLESLRGRTLPITFERTLDRVFVPGKIGIH